MKLLSEESLRKMLLEVWAHGKQAGMKEVYDAQYAHATDIGVKKNLAERDQLIDSLVEKAGP